MTRFLLLLIAILTSIMPLWAKQKAVVWNSPATEYNPTGHDGVFYPLLEINSVELRPDETLLHFTAALLDNRDYDFSSETYILVDSVRYDAVSADGMNLTDGIKRISDDVKHFTLRFPPLPQDARSFDFFNGSKFAIKGINDGSRRRASILPSDWRDDKTGDWLISFYDEGVIYDSRFWNYAGAKPGDGKSTFDITDGKSTVAVSVGKAKNGRRKIKIDGRATDCSIITGRTLPPYPVPDLRTGFKDTRFASVDSVTVNGWLRNRPDWAKAKVDSYEISVYTGGINNGAYASKIDSIGRFSITFPVINSSGIYCDWEQTFLRNFVEPGETYFLLYDFDSGRTMFMGSDSRVQNELLRHPLTWRDVTMYSYTDQASHTFDKNKFFSDTKALDAKLDLELDSLLAVEPLLSERFKNRTRGHRTANMAFNLGQTVFTSIGIPEDIAAYAMERCWGRLERPYSLDRFNSTFLDNIMRHLNRNWRGTFNSDSLEATVYTPEEQEVLDRFKKLDETVQAGLDSISQDSLRAAYRKKMLADNMQLLKEYMAVRNGQSRKFVLRSREFLYETKAGMAVMDSLDADPLLKEIWLRGKAGALIDNLSHSLPDDVISFLNENIKTKLILQPVMDRHNAFLQIENRNVSADKNLYDKAFEGVSEGRDMLARIIEPHKGKIVLIDVWGTWCAPCRQAMKDAQLLYKRLKDYDMVYVYLANSSPESSWRNLIEECNAKGDNVYHYNLPPSQQAEIETFLKVSGYPTFRLVDREGHLLDVNADPRRAGALETILKNL